MSSEITESGKAVQEVAKATNTAIAAAQDLGKFVARIIGEPAAIASEMLCDRLRFARAERLIRLRSRFEEFLGDREIVKPLRGVAMKIALPILEQASLEEDDELQDLWASLLASAADPSFDGTLRTAFIDILKQLEVIDVHILQTIYRHYEETREAMSRESDPELWMQGTSDPSPTNLAIEALGIMTELKIDSDLYENSIDNLMRLRCISSFVETKMLHSDGGRQLFQMYEYVSFDHRYDNLCMTAFGVSFVEACLGRRQFSPKSV